MNCDGLPFLLFSLLSLLVLNTVTYFALLDAKKIYLRKIEAIDTFLNQIKDKYDQTEDSKDRN